MRHYVKQVRFSLAIRYYNINMHNILISSIKNTVKSFKNDMEKFHG
jgi:hypothetical protein